MRRTVMACVLALGGAACSLFTPLSGFTNGDESPGDGGPGSAIDGGGGSDAPPGDAPPTGEDAAPTTGFCNAQSPAPALCMDFDEGAGGPPSGWTTQLDVPGGVERVSSPLRSSPSSLRAWIDPGAGVRYAYWARPIGTTVAHARLSYSIFVETRPSTAEVEINMLRFDTGQTQNYFYLALHPNTAEYWEQYNTQIEEKATPLSPSLPIDIGKWHRVSVELTLGNIRAIRIAVDGATIVDKALTQIANPGTVLLTSGITWASANTDKAKIVLDDVLFEILP